MYGGADILGTPDLFIEAKRVERLNFHDAMRQAEGNIIKIKTDDSPVVVNRKNQMKTGDSLCLVRLDFFLELYKSYLQQKGFTNSGEPDNSPLPTLQDHEA